MVKPLLGAPKPTPGRSDSQQHLEVSAASSGQWCLGLVAGGEMPCLGRGILGYSRLGLGPSRIPQSTWEPGIGT